MLYVVKENQWHSALLEPDSNQLIIENRDTGELNSDNYRLAHTEKETISKLVSELND